MNSQLFHFKDFLLDTLFPSFCLSCKARGESFCDLCSNKSIIDRPLEYCLLCARFSGKSGMLCKSDRVNLGLRGLVSAFNFREDAVKKQVHSFKYESVYSAIGKITDKAFFVAAPALLNQNFDAIVPVPLSFWRYKERGYNQAEIIAKSLTEKLDAKIDLRLKKIKETERQVDLSKDERGENLLGAFVFNGKISGKVLLVDDVVTTGSTFKSAAKVLKSAGASEVWGFALAHEEKD